MRFFDIHSHITPYSHDADQTIEQLLSDAAQKGLMGISSADHYEKDMFYDRGYEDIYDPGELFAKLLPYRRTFCRNSSNPAFLIGTELGWLPRICDHLYELTSSYPFDSIILSMHVFDGKDPFVDADFYDDGIKVVYPRAIERMLDMVTSFTDFDILGHFDYISRYVKTGGSKLLYSHAPDQFDSLFRSMISSGKSLEINTRTTVRLRSCGYSDADSFPDINIFKRYLELGGEFISIGSDSHHYGHAALIFDEFHDWLGTLGINRLTYFVERKPEQYQI